MLYLRCPTSQAIAPGFAALSDQFSQFVFVNIDIDTIPETAANYIGGHGSKLNVLALPTIFVFKNQSK
jgi:thiol-disulfide isomerase/thioredoxin